MKRLPLVDITSGDDVIYARIQGRMVAFMWRAGEFWFTAGPGRNAQPFTSQTDAMRRLLDIATKERES